MRLPFPLSALVLAVPVLATGARSEQLPPMLQDLAGQDMAACREGGGDPILGPDYASSADLNGDGVPDYLINLAGLECAGASSYFCGSAGCPVNVWISGGGGWTNEWSGYAQEARIVGTAVEAHLHGEFCDPKRDAYAGCDLRLEFASAAPVPETAPAAAPETAPDAPRPTGRVASLPEAAPEAGAGPVRTLPDLPEGWTVRGGDGAPMAAMAPGPGEVHSLVAFCQGTAPVLSLILSRTDDAPTILVQFAFDDWTFGETAGLEGPGTGVYTMPLGRDALAARLAGRDASVRVGLDRTHQGTLSLSGSTRALREALRPCPRL